MEEIAVFQRAYNREKEARKEAERVIEKKSGELYYASKELEQLNASLEKKIKERTAELESERRKAEESSIAKERFLANMSHEIRTPMNAIVGFTNLMLKYSYAGDQQKYLDAIQASADNLLVIIDDILDFSKIEAGKLDIDPINFDLKDTIETLLFPFRNKASEKGIELEFHFDDSIDRYVNTDPVRLRQILNNLISNAIKFTSKGSVSLNCNLLPSSDGLQEVEFVVMDTGTGIKKSNLGKIFESFSQEDQSITRKFGGTGLGLAICKKLVTLLNGEISVESKLGQGTSFKVVLPMKKQNNVNTIDNFQSNQTVSNSSFDDLRILLVEDNEFNQILVQSILQNSNINLDIASNGKMAVDILKRKSYDIILMDIQMPEMGGIEATRILRSNFKIKTPIIALTANAFKKDREAYLQAGMDDYLSKPFKESDLFEKIDKLLNSNMEKNLFDLDGIESISKGDEIAKNNILSKLIISFEKLLSETLAAVSERDLNGCKMATHTMKASMRLINANNILDLIEQIEHLEYFDEKIIQSVAVQLKSKGNELLRRLKEVSSQFKKEAA